MNDGVSLLERFARIVDFVLREKKTLKPQLEAAEMRRAADHNECTPSQEDLSRLGAAKRWR